MSDSENNKITGIHPGNDRINNILTIIICTIFTGYILKNIYEYITYFNKKTFAVYAPGYADSRKYFENFSKICYTTSSTAFLLLFTLILLLFLYIIKDSYYLNELNKDLITIGFPIILGIYFLNTILFTMNKTKDQLSSSGNNFYGFTSFLTKNFFEVPKKEKLFIPKPNLLYVMNPLNLTILISIIYMIYWDNWDYPSWKKWSIYISSVIIFNVLLASIYFFRTRETETEKNKQFSLNNNHESIHSQLSSMGSVNSFTSNNQNNI